MAEFAVFEGCPYQYSPRLGVASIHIGDRPMRRAALRPDSDAVSYDPFGLPRGPSLRTPAGGVSMSDQSRARAPESRFTEFTVGSETIALIADETNERAWIQSNVTMAVEQ